MTDSTGSTGSTGGDPLPPKQREVFDLAERGWSIAAIAWKTNRHESSVKQSLDRAYRKMGVKRPRMRVIAFPPDLYEALQEWNQDELIITSVGTEHWSDEARENHYDQEHILQGWVWDVIMGQLFRKRE